MERIIGLLNLPLSIFMFVVFVQQDIWIGLYIIPLLMLFGGISMLIGDKKSSSETINKTKSVSDKVITGGVGIIVLFVVIGLLGGYDSCEEKYRKAWEACNQKYNGKCSYLGKDFKPSCDLDN